ncbi:MAG: NADH-quinone oxidoreductase subunit M, partial [Gammaproteobacteria bacterium]|nr:NADH-quinone oxidoreductase subunit M [Gammaproteobacteria bacterium]
METSLLSILIWFPIVAGIIVLGVSKGPNHDSLVRKLALGFSIATFLLSIPLYTGFDRTTTEMQFTEFHSWIPAFNIHYALGVDGFSVPLILLTTLLTVIVVVAGWQVIQDKVAQYMAAFLIMEGIMIGVFSALD